MLVPKRGLSITVEDDETNDNDECLMYPGKTDQKNDQANDATLQHYKNEAMKLK